MSLQFKAVELADAGGQRLGLFRLCVISDERSNLAVPLCKCPGGHLTSDEAVKCKKAAAAARTIHAGESLEGWAQ